MSSPPRTEAYCTACGNLILPSQAFCRRCGANLMEQEQIQRALEGRARDRVPPTNYNPTDTLTSQQAMYAQQHSSPRACFRRVPPDFSTHDHNQHGHLGHHNDRTRSASRRPSRFDHFRSRERSPQPDPIPPVRLYQNNHRGRNVNPRNDAEPEHGKSQSNSSRVQMKPTQSTKEDQTEVPTQEDEEQREKIVARFQAMHDRGLALEARLAELRQKEDKAMAKSPFQKTTESTTAGTGKATGNLDLNTQHQDPPVLVRTQTQDLSPAQMSYAGMDSNANDTTIKTEVDIPTSPVAD